MSSTADTAAPDTDLMRGLFYEELAVGQTFGGITLTVTEGMVTSACGLFQDTAPLHRSHAVAEGNGFRGLIAPGSLTSGLAIAPIALIAGKASATHLEDHVRFRAPVYVDDTLTVTLKVGRKEPRSRFGLVEYEITVVNGDGERVAEVTTLMGHRYLPASAD